MIGIDNLLAWPIGNRGIGATEELVGCPLYIWVNLDIFSICEINHRKGDILRPASESIIWCRFFIFN